MNLLDRIKRLEKLQAELPDDVFALTHDEFLALTMAEIILCNRDLNDIEGADRIRGIRYHPKRIAPRQDVSPISPTALTAHVEEVAAAMSPRILRLKDAYESGDRTAYHRQQAKDRKALLAKAEGIVDRVEAGIDRMAQTAG